MLHAVIDNHDSKVINMTMRLPEESDYDTEEQFILRLNHPEASKKLAHDIASGVDISTKTEIEWKPDMRNAVVRYDGQVFYGRLVDLPCIIESMKTLDQKIMYKTSDICQMLICSPEPVSDPIRGTLSHLDKQSGSRKRSFDFNHENREHKYLHGITPPMKNVLHRRFRKTRKRSVDMQAVEKEVRRMLLADLQADSVEWEVVWSTQSDKQPPADSCEAVNQSDEMATSTADNQSLQPGGSVDAVTGALNLADKPFIDRDDIFGEVSSSDEDSSVDSPRDRSLIEGAVSDSSAHLSQTVDGAGGKIDTSAAHPITPANHQSAAAANKARLAAELDLSESSSAHSSDEEEVLDDGNDAVAQLVRQQEDDLIGGGPDAVETSQEEEMMDQEAIDDESDDDDDDGFVHGGGELLLEDEEEDEEGMIP